MAGNRIRGACVLLACALTCAAAAVADAPGSLEEPDMTSEVDVGLAISQGGLTVRLDSASGALYVDDGDVRWRFGSSYGGFARLTILEEEPTSIEVPPPVQTHVLGGAGATGIAWSRPDPSTLTGEGALTDCDLRFALSFTIQPPRRLACTLSVDGADVGAIADIAFPPGPILTDPEARLVFPQWLGLLVAPAGPDIHVRRVLYQRPWCMRFIGGTQQTPQGEARSFIAIIEDSLYRGADVWRSDGALGFDFWGDRSYPERTSEHRAQSLTFEFIEGDYVQIARRYRRWAQQQPTWTTLATRFRPCAPDRVGGAMAFCHVPCDYGGEPLPFDALIPRLEALKAAGVHRAIVHVGGWNRKGYDAEYPDILPANPACGGDEGMARLVSAIRDLGYVCAPHDDIGIMAENAPSFDEQWLARWFDQSRINGGVYRDAQNYITSAKAQVHFATRNLPEVARRYPDLDGYLFDVTTSVQPLEDYSSDPPVLRQEDLALRMEAFRIAREAFARFTMGESIMDWAIEYNDVAFMAEEGYFHQGDGGWAKDDLHGEIVPLWDLVYHDVQIALRDAADHVNTPMETEDPLVRYVRVLLKTLRAGTLPPALFSDDLTLNVVRAMLTGESEAAGGWATLDERELIAAVSRISTWLADEVFLAEMVHHEFPDGDLHHEYTQFRSARGLTKIWINSALEPWSPRAGLVLPPLGFWIEGPDLCAYHVDTVDGVRLPTPVLGAVRGAFASGEQVEAFRAFGGSDLVVPLDSGYASVPVAQAGVTVDVTVP